MKLNFLDLEYLFDEKNIITDHERVDPKTNKFTKDGLFSEEVFGSLTSDGTQYSCKCGEYVGKFYEGKICENRNCYKSIDLD